MQERVTEQASFYRHLEKMAVSEILRNINREDKSVPLAVEEALPQIIRLVTVVSEKLRAGGRLFYLGAGTSGRLGVLDASDCKPAYGVPETMITGIMAGGEAALQKGLEDAEDDPEGGWRDLQLHEVGIGDIVVGIAASGSTPYVAGALKRCREQGIVTGCIVSNLSSLVAAQADCPVEVITGPEFITGSTRMKCGTAQKMVLNMISTTAMIAMGLVQDNCMVHLKNNNI